MSVRSAGKTIREARKHARLSQEQLSEGICSLSALSHIEKGSAGVSPATFQALMAHAGVSGETYPIFENWNEYECFSALKHARFYLDAWQLASAEEELSRPESLNWNRNKYYYQEWLLLHSMLQFRSGTGNHNQIYQTLSAALHISRPEINLFNFQKLLLSIPEIEILICLAQESLYLNKPETCLSICTQISKYLEKNEITFLEKDKLLAEHAIVYAKYLISIKDYQSALEIADLYRHQMVLNRCDAPLFELNFLTGLANLYLNEKEKALKYFKDTFYSAHSIDSAYATTCRNYIVENGLLELPENLLSVPDLPLTCYAQKEIIDVSDFSDGVYDFYGTDVVTIGTLIKTLRTQQKVHQETLCQGLCSKSTLSKIENGLMNPNIILAETLLQRLGISEREFIFWGGFRRNQIP